MDCCVNIEQKDTSLLINEWQLGQQLNCAVQNGTRDKFNLLLSFLSDDPRDFAQFSLAKDNLQTEPLKKQDLRATFHLADGQPLVNKGISVEQAKSYNQDLHNNNVTSIRLKQLLSNEALLSRSAKIDFASDIVDNLPLLSQQRLFNSLVTAEKTEVQQQNIPATGINNELIAQYKSLDLDNKPIKVHYM